MLLRLSRLEVPRISHRSFFTLPSLLSGGTDIQSYHEEKSLPYTRQQLYSVVADVASYKHFIPFCSASRVLSTTGPTQLPTLLDAELTVQFLAFKESYVSRVTCTPLESVKAVASSSTPLFKTLTTTWRFQSIPPSASTPPAAGDSLSLRQSTDSSPTLVSLDLAFAFANPLHATVSSAFFGQVSKLMVNAFEQRCADVYGAHASKTP